jgi:hypothetical protein
MILPTLAIGLWIGAILLILLGTIDPAGQPVPAGAGSSLRSWLVVPAYGLLDKLRSLRHSDRGTETLAVAGLFLAAWLTRGTLTGAIPWLLAGDEASGGVTALQFLGGERDNPFGVGWYDFPSLYFFVQSLSVRFFGNTTEALRLTSALAGTLTVVATYWFLREAFGRGVALAGAAYLSAFHFHIHFSRLGLNNIWDGLFLTLALAAFWRGWNRNERASFALAGLSLGLAQYFYSTGRILLLLIPIWLGVALVGDRTVVKSRLPGLLLAALAGLVVVLPLALFYAVHPESFTAPYSRASLVGPVLSQLVKSSGEPMGQILLEQFKTGALAFTSTHLRSWYQPPGPILAPLPAALFLMGVCLILLRLNRLPELTLGLWLGCSVAVGALTESTPAAQRYVFVAPAVAGAIGLTLERSARWLTQSWPDSRRPVLISLGGLLLLMAVNDLRFYFVDYSAGHRFADVNTEVANRVGEFLADRQPGTQVYFFGGRMGYYSHSTIPYLAPEANGTDIPAGLSAPPDWPMVGQAVFIFLPEREADLAWVREAYPGGRLHRVTGSQDPLFLAYELPEA